MALKFAYYFDEVHKPSCVPDSTHHAMRTALPVTQRREPEGYMIRRQERYSKLLTNISIALLFIY